MKSKSIIHLHFNSLANTKTNQEKNQSRERAVQTPHTSNSAKNNHIKVDGTAKDSERDFSFRSELLRGPS